MNTQITPIGFWDELWKANKSERPTIVRKFGIDKKPEKLNYIAVNMNNVFGIIASVRSALIDQEEIDENSFEQYKLIMNGKR